jgi:choline dehydrogenase-like flavoprotein
MLSDLEEFDDDVTCQGDVCVVGGGAVGLVVAVQLSRMGKRVILLEGGGVGLEERSQALHRTITAGHPAKRKDFGRYRVLGGTTIHWAGGVVPLNPIVFEDRAWVTDAKWPFTIAELDPYHLKAYELIGLENVELDDSKIWRKIGVDPDLGPDLGMMLTRWTPRRNFARVFKKEIDGPGNLRAFVHANVTGFSLDETGQKITSVKARSFNGKQITVNAKSVVLACGTIEIARLLLQPSGNDVPYPWQANPWIGRGFIDHIDRNAGTVEILDKSAFHKIFDSVIVNRLKYSPRINLNTDVQRKQGTLDIAANFNFESMTLQHLVNIKYFIWSIIDGRMPDQIWRLPIHVMAVMKITFPIAFRYLMDHRLYKPASGTVYLRLTSEQIPNPASCVRLVDEKDELGMRRIEVDWKFDGREIRTFAIFSRLIRDAMRERGIAEITLDPDLENESQAYFEKVVDGNHHMSTARIGNTADEGVVDSDLRVHGTENLYVAGAAVFPASGFANSTLTSLALGLRLCDHLERISR